MTVSSLLTKSHCTMMTVVLLRVLIYSMGTDRGAVTMGLMTAYAKIKHRIKNVKRGQAHQNTHTGL